MQKHIHALKVAAIVASLAASLALAAAIIVGVRPPASTTAPERPVRLEDAAAAVLRRPPLPAAAQQALERLAAKTGMADISAVGHEHEAMSAQLQTLGAADQERFDAQWAAGAAAAAQLDTPQKAAAAGYVPATTELPQVGAHWVNWTLVSRPFDPAKPAMLLFATLGGKAQLVGFSYYLKSAAAPEGFAGPNDAWHRHAGLCFVHGWLVVEGLPFPRPCEGQWLNGDDLWMLHAWLVPQHANPAGPFAPSNPQVCPDGAACTAMAAMHEHPAGF